MVFILQVESCLNYETVGLLNLAVIDNGELSFDDARKKCISCGGQLAETHNFEQHEALKYFAAIKNIIGCIWIGITDRQVEGE